MPLVGLRRQVPSGATQGHMRWPVAVACGCGLWLWPVAVACGAGCIAVCKGRYMTRWQGRLVLTGKLMVGRTTLIAYT